MQRVKLLVIFSLIVCFSASAQNKERWRKIENNSFSFSLPISFKKTPEVGIDSFVQAYAIKQMRLSFDYGSYSPDFRDWPANTKIERVTINGRAATIGTVARPIQKGYPYSTQVYFKVADNLDLSMFAACKTEEQIRLARRIFETISFKTKPA